jgi:hypothetical protein
MTGLKAAGLAGAVGAIGTAVSVGALRTDCRDCSSRRSRSSHRECRNRNIYRDRRGYKVSRAFGDGFRFLQQLSHQHFPGSCEIKTLVGSLLVLFIYVEVYVDTGPQTIYHPVLCLVDLVRYILFEFAAQTI